MTHEIVQNRVRELRIVLGLTQEQLANLVGLARQSIISIEKGQYLPSIETALRLSAALQVPVEHLFWLKDDAK
jgi:DNA-binding XRE family transcriptional regulator